LIKSEGNEEKRSVFRKIFDPINSYAFYLRALSERSSTGDGGGKLGRKPWEKHDLVNSQISFLEIIIVFLNRSNYHLIQPTAPFGRPFIKRNPSRTLFPGRKLIKEKEWKID
jgi:hypothetical protein